MRRALLFMPGDDRHKIEKGAALEVDAVIMDLEDGVALSHKQAGRQTTAAALREVDFGRTERMVRINPVSTSLWQADLEAVLPAQPDAIVIPKVENGDQVQHVAAQAGDVPLLAVIETALGVIRLDDIATSSLHLSALIFGAEDLAGNIGARRTPDGWEVFYARSAVVLHARAHGLDAIDTPFVDLTAEDSHLLADTEQALYMGYTGKLAIHPRQVSVIQNVLTPTDEQIQRAKALIQAHEAQQAEGVGVFEFEGKMVDMPMVRAAQQILQRARAAGKEV